jgi:hypothetical protein
MMLQDWRRVNEKHGSIEDFRADKFQSLEPSIKDKLINDTVRVNYLRE